MNIQEILKSNQAIMVVVNPSDLKEFASSIIDELMKNRPDEKAEEYLTRKEAADTLKVDVSTLWRWEKSGYLLSKKIGAKVVYAKSDIEKILS